MEKELLNSDKELLLKDLCGRLPYGVKVHTSLKSICTIFSKPTIYSTVVIDGAGVEVCNISDIKPYLFPLSSMTEEQKKEYEYECKKDLKVLSHSLSTRTYTKTRISTPLYYGIDWLNANKFDYRGLIPMGLALDATGLNIY